MKFKHRKKVLFLGLVGTLLSGCSRDKNYIDDYTVRTVHQLSHDMTKVVNYKDKYQLILGNFGASLSQYARFKYAHYRDINIEVYEIVNKTTDDKLPFSSQGMLLNSVGRLTATSGNFFPLKHITADIGTIVAVDDATKYTEVPRVLQLQGSIDRSDIIYSKSHDGSVDGTGSYHGQSGDLGFSRNDSDNIREISLSLRFINKQKGTGFNTYSRYGYAENTIRISKKSFGRGFGVFLLGNGVTSNASKTITPGVHQAINILIQHTIIQAFGRNFEVPYWHCSDMYQVDELQKNNMRHDWARKSEDAKIKAIQLVLNMYGFSIPIGSKAEPAIKKTELALIAIKQYLGFDGNIQDFNYYFNLYNNMPFAGFFPKNYNALKVGIDNVNSGELPFYVEKKRALPKLPVPREIESSSTIIRGDGTTDIVIHSKPKPKPTPNPIVDIRNAQQRAIDKEEALLFK